MLSRFARGGGALVLAVVWILGSGEAAAADVDPFVGTWRLAPDECRYASGSPLPAEMTIVIGSTENGIIYRSHTVFQGGQASDAEYAAAYDERPVLVTGTSGLLVPVALRRINRKTVDATYSRAFQVIARSRRTLDSSGNVMTITTTEYQPDGASRRSIAVFHRSLTPEQS